MVSVIALVLDYVLQSYNFFLNRQKKRLKFRLYIFKEVNENVNGRENFVNGRENFVNGREN